MQRAKRASTRSLLISAKCKLHVNLRASSSHSTSLHIQTPSKQHHHGPDHRTIHPGLLREVRGFPEGPWCGFHPEEGGSCLHPGDDHHRGGRQLDHGHQDHRQEHRAEIQVGKTRLSLTRMRHLTFQTRGRVWGRHDGWASLQDNRDLGGEHDDHHPERHQGGGEERGRGESRSQSLVMTCLWQFAANKSQTRFAFLSLADDDHIWAAAHICFLSPF